MPYELVSCGNCPKCLAGAKVHGPYPYHFEGGRNDRRHLYGEGEGDSMEPLSKAEAKRMRAEAEEEYEELEQSLTPEQRAKLRDVMGRLAVLKRVRRRRKRAQDEEVAKQDRESQEATGKGLTRRAIDEIVREIGEQFEAEIAEAKRQISREKAELSRMLRDGK